MRESVTYKAIRRLLQKTSLKREKSDWEKMNDLLDQHLPIDPSAGGGGPGAAGSPFNFTIPVIVVGIVILATTIFIFSRSGKSYNTGKNPQIAIKTLIVKTRTNNKIPSGSNNNIPADDSLQSRLKAHKTLPDSVQDNLTIDLTNVSKKLANNAHESGPDKSTTLTNPVVTKNSIEHENYGPRNKKLYAQDQSKNRNINNRKTNHNNKILVVPNTASSVVANTNALSNSRRMNAEGTKKSERSSPAGTENSVSERSTKSRNRYNHSHQQLKIDLASLIITRDPEQNFHTEWKSGKPMLNAAILTKVPKGNNIRNQRDSSRNKNDAVKKKTDSPDMNRSFKYGLMLPLLQVYNSDGVQSTRLNYIPGISAAYKFNKHLGLGVNILPYQTVNLNSKDSIFGSSQTDTTNGRNKTTTNTYYISSLNTFNAGLHFVYQINPHFGFEIGFGYQHFYNGNGHIATQIKDTTSSSVFNQNTHYSTGDSASVNIGKSNFNYYLNAVYSINKWDILLGYNLNSKSWITVPGATSFGWINLEIRYYFSTSGKK